MQRLPVTLILLLAALAAPGLVPAQGVSVRMAVIVPVADSAPWFTTGGSLDLAYLVPGGGPSLRPELGLDAAQIPFITAGSVLLFTPRIGLESDLELAPGWAWGLKASLGPSFGASASLLRSGTTVSLELGTGTVLSLAPTLAVRLDAGWRYWIGLLNTVQVALSFDVNAEADR